MKIVQWTDDDVPPVNTLPNGDGIVADCKFWWNLEQGDLIQYITEVGTSCYLVIDIQPATTSDLGDGVVNCILRGV